MNELANISRDMKTQMAQIGMDAVSAETDAERKKLAGLLSRREETALEVLDLVQAEVIEPEEERNILAGPWPGAICGTAALICIVLGLPAIAAVCCAPAIAAVIPAIYNKKKHRKQASARLYINEDEMKRYLLERRQRIGIDLRSIDELYAAVDTGERSVTQSDAVAIYSALHESLLDDPDNVEMEYPLRVAEGMLRRMGLELVDYGPDTREMFDVLPIEGKDMQRQKAIREKESGLLVKKGLYLKGRGGN